MNRTRIFQYLIMGTAATVIAVSLAATGGCGKGEKPDATSDSTAHTDSAAQAVMIGPENYTIVTQQRIESGPAISGNLAPKKTATMRAQSSGAVLRATAEQGQRVGAGALLAKLDDRAIGDAITSAQAAVTTAKSTLDIAQREQSRLETLEKAGAIAVREVENSQRNVVAAQGALAQAQAQLTAAHKQLSLTEVHAPFSGVVSMKMVSTGDIVQPGTALYTIVDPSSMELAALIPAEDLTQVKIGSQVQFNVSGYPDRTFNGTITRINPTADPATRQVKVFAEIPNAGNTLLGDLFAQGRVTASAHSALTVPATAIDKRMMKPSVTKLDNGQTKQIEVTLGVNDERSGRIEILSGVAAGDTLLIGPAIQITVGTRVQITQGAGGSTTATQARRTP